LAALSGFFLALWAAIDGQALSTLAAERAKSTEAFLGAWGDCLVWIIERLIKGVDDAPSSSIADGLIEHVGTQQPCGDVDEVSSAAVSLALVGDQFARLVGEIGKGLKVDASVAGEKVAVVFARMEAVGRGASSILYGPQLDRHLSAGEPVVDILDGAWTQVSGFARITIASLDHGARGEYALAFLAALHQRLSLKGSSKRKVEALVAGIATEIVERCLGHAGRSDTGLEKVKDYHEMLLRDGKVLEQLLEHFGDVLEQENDFIQVRLQLHQPSNYSSILTPFET